MKSRPASIILVALLIADGFVGRTIAADRTPIAKATALLPFEFYPRNRKELGLTAEQVSEMERLANGIHQSVQDFEAERGQRTRELQETMAEIPVDVEKATAHFQAVLEVEDKLKTLQFRSGVTMRNTLSADQLRKLQVLATSESAVRGAGVRAELTERLQHLRSEIYKRTAGEVPPEIVARLKEIEQSVSAGRFSEAKNQLEQILQRLRHDSEPDAAVATKPSVIPADGAASVAQDLDAITGRVEQLKDPELRAALHAALRGAQDAMAANNYAAAKVVVSAVEFALQKSPGK